MPIKKLATLSIAFLLVAPFVLAQDTLTVQRVIDGATLELSDGRTVRLIGIDTPEFGDQARNKRNAEKYGIEPRRYAEYAQKAKDFLIDLVEGKEVRTEFDPINTITGHHDKYARFLAYLYVSDVFVNAEIVRQGYGLTYRKFSFRHKNEFLELEQEAKENNRGLWQRTDRFGALRQTEEVQELISKHDEIVRQVAG